MNVRDLEYFVAVAEEGGFGSAARRCFVSQPTLSGQVKKLEEELGHALFERSTRRVRLTDFGEEALPLAREALSAVATLAERAAARRDPFVGPVSLGAFPTLGPWLLPRLVQLLSRAYPESEFYLVEDKSPYLVERIRSGTLDAAFLAMPVEDEAVVQMPLFSEAFHLAVPEGHPLAAQASISLSSLRGEPLLLLEDGHCLRDQALDLCRRFGATEMGRFRATGLETLRQMIRMGLGLTLMPRLAISESPEPGIRYVPVSEPEARREIALCCRKTHPRRALFEHLAEALRGFAAASLPVTAMGSSGEG